MPCVIPSLKLNKFEEHSIPKPAELFARFGYTKKAGLMTGDEVVRTDLSKVEQIAEVEKEALSKED